MKQGNKGLISFERVVRIVLLCYIYIESLLTTFSLYLGKTYYCLWMLAVTTSILSIWSLYVLTPLHILGSDPACAHSQWSLDNISVASLGSKGSIEAQRVNWRWCLEFLKDVKGVWRRCLDFLKDMESFIGAEGVQRSIQWRRIHL